MNIQGLTTNLNQLKLLMDAKQPIAAILSETHITFDINHSEINIKGYNLLRCNSHSRHTGGVIIYVKKDVRFKLLKNCSIDKELWLLGIELRLENISYSVYGVYNRCSESKYIRFLSDFCENEIDFSKINVIIGDINIDLLSDYHYSKKLKECMNDSTMKQIVTEPTRITRSSKTLIDHIMTNDVNQVKYKILNDELISDHSTVQIILKKSEIPIERETIEILKYVSDLQNFFSNNDCDLLQGSDVNQKSRHFMSVIKDFISKHTNSKELKERNDTKWYNSDLKKLKETKDVLYETALMTDNESDWCLFKRARNKCE